ncbi:hypothetical protein N6B72_13835 [Chryseobacterium soli]|uniref:YobI family P-loop NTPase n=1 Tax=Chryseobacterium soli TaxID=445961 RepID=UPI00295326B2|nr:hypothetical protein [Chryseobacterium soli]MDV7698002.1 hypothetical protein [Chryseobacterium soli]
MNKNLFSNFFRKKVDVEETIISSLAPKILTKPEDIDKIQPYLDQLKDTLNVKGINNIALTGGYGSGKSTILKTFQHINKDDYNFLNISLAAFNQKKLKENFKEIYDIKISNGKTKDVAEKEIANEFKETIISTEELERQLEISILQQIIYKVKPSNLPESRFKRIINIPNWKLWLAIPISFIIWISSVVLLFKYNFLDRLNPNEWTFKFRDTDLAAYIVFIISFLGIGFFSKIIVSLFSNSKINKVNLKGEIEIGDNSNTSILNEHYDEILYYFEKNPFNVVVIEDLDRFDNTNIFTKLRELNILLNNADTLNSKKGYKKIGIKFLYAVGDDLFDDKKERVKFFEYIIPVIPFINSSNAHEQLRNLIKESGLDENILTRDLISDVTTFIEDIDMRLLTNIFHEFVIYRKTLRPEYIKRNDELFAMITYKNLDPKDFNKLNKKEGKLYDLINNKETYIKDYINKVDKEISDKNTEIRNVEKQLILDIEELKIVYLQKILTKLPSNALISKSIIESDIEDLIANGTISYNYSQYGSVYSSNIDFDFSEIENEVDENFSFNERSELIESNQRKNFLKSELDNLKIKKSKIENWDLKQIFNEIELNQYLDGFSNNKLLRNLILNGYINENYNDYISLFHEVSITKEDFTFIRNVKSGYLSEFDYKLSDKIENIVSRIDKRYFEREVILNFDLLNYIGNDFNKYSVKYDSIIRLLSNEKIKSIEFIDSYIKDENRPLKIFIEKLTKNWKNFWDFIYFKSNYTEDKVNHYLKLMIQFAEVETIISNQNNISLCESIEKNSKFLSLMENEENTNYFGKITKLIEKLNIKFDKLDNPTEDTIELFEYIYNYHHYKINKDNVLQMLLVFGRDTNSEDDFKKRNYSTIINSECNLLIEYINTHINNYVENVYLKLDENKFDYEIDLKNLLNNHKLKDNLKAKIVQKVDTKISKLKDISDLGFQSVLLLNNKVLPTWDNVIDYYKSNGSKITDILTNYLNFEDVYSELSKQKLSKENEEFEISLIKCEELLNQSYTALLNSTHNWNNIKFENLNIEKVISLLNKRLSVTKDNYDRLRTNFPNNHIKLVEKDFVKFYDNLEEFETNEEDVVLLLKSDKITLNSKIMYIKKLQEQTIYESKNISELIGNLILQNGSEVPFESTTIAFIIKNSSSIESRVKITNLYLDSLSNSDLIEVVKNIGYAYKELFVKQHKPTFKKTDYNYKLLNTLKSKELINSFDIDKKDINQYRAVANY